MRDCIIKTKDGFERDDGSARYVYDAAGHYLGQWQPDILTEDVSALEMFLKTFPGDRCYHELSAEEMAAAA